MMRHRSEGGDHVTTTSIEQARLGRTDLVVSRVCYGTAPIGHMPEVYGHGSSDELAYATVRAIFDGPSNFLDTSRNYGAGRSEERIGHVIRERAGAGGFRARDQARPRSGDQQLRRIRHAPFA